MPVCFHTHRHRVQSASQTHLVPWFHNSTVDKYSMAKTESSKMVMYS